MEVWYITYKACIEFLFMITFLAYVMLSFYGHLSILLITYLHG
jgi:hypothetical protein